MATPTTAQRWALRVLRLHLRRRRRRPRRRDPPGHGVRGHPRHLVLPGLRRAQARLHPLRRLMCGQDPTKALPPVTRLVARLTGARLCFGRPGHGERPHRDHGRERAQRRAAAASATRARTARAAAAAARSRRGRSASSRSAPPGTRFERIDDGRTALRAIGAGHARGARVGRDLPPPPRAARCRAARSAARCRARRRAAPPPPRPPRPSWRRRAAARPRPRSVEPALVGQRVARPPRAPPA